jgi:hypothetical protein
MDLTLIFLKETMPVPTRRFPGDARAQHHTPRADVSAQHSCYLTTQRHQKQIDIPTSARIKKLLASEQFIHYIVPCPSQLAVSLPASVIDPRLQGTTGRRG